VLSSNMESFPFIEAPKPKKKKKSIKQDISSPLETVTTPSPLPLDGANGSASDKRTDDGRVSPIPSSSQADTTLGKTPEPSKKLTKPRTYSRNYFKPHNGCEFNILLPAYSSSIPLPNVLPLLQRG